MAKIYLNNLSGSGAGKIAVRNGTGIVTVAIEDDYSLIHVTEVTDAGVTTHYEAVLEAAGDAQTVAETTTEIDVAVGVEETRALAAEAAIELLTDFLTITGAADLDANEVKLAVIYNTTGVDAAAVYADIGVIATGTMAISSAGKLFVQVAATDEAASWEIVTTT